MPTLVKFIIFILCILLNVAFFTLLERKVLSYIQTRKGPNKAGYKGILQPISDAIKLFTKEMIVLTQSSQWIFTLGPTLSLTLMMTLWLSVPSPQGFSEIKISSVFVLCIMSLGVYPIFLSGWASNSKYSLLGGLRAIAQTISYEVSLSIILLSFLTCVGSLSLSGFLSHQGFLLFFVLPFLSVMWLISCLAETGRSPYDLPEGESELVSGFNTEYSSGTFALFFLSEYGMMLFLSFISSHLLFSGSPYFGVAPLGSLLLSYMFVWVRGTFPRVRYDMLMNMTWKEFLPSSLGLLSFILAFTV